MTLHDRPNLDAQPINAHDIMNRTRSNILLAGCLLLLAPFLRAQGGDLPYESGSTGADGALVIPKTLLDRYGFAYAYDPGDNRIVLHGGRRYTPATYFPHTLLFDGTSWQQVETNGFVSARTGAEMVYDPVRDVVMMFGGLRADNVRMNDTWIWDGADWTQLNPATSPTPRHNHEMVWDPVNQRVLLFGGNNNSNQDLMDLWAWDGTNWSQIITTNGPRASYNYSEYQQLVFEVSEGRLVLYNTGFQETYVLNLDTLTWSLLSTSAKPVVGVAPRMVWDATRNYILLSGGSSNIQTWKFENSNWVQLTPASDPAWSYYHGLIHNTSDGKIYRFYGLGNSATFQETYAWDGTDWSFVVGRNYTFDMSQRPDGIWNFTTIDVPSHVDVYFKSNQNNSPVVWLATGNVQIDGRVHVSGQHAVVNDQSGTVARGGPGGFDGGIGGVRFDVSGSYLGTSGQGPGGGDAPSVANTPGQGGRYNGVYGNRLIQPLIGGSGGAGASSTDSTSGGNGGGGGGAILIASSRDVVINGGIFANGGQARAGASQFNSRYGGGGSGGAIRIVADRISGSGSLQANGGDSFSGGGFDGGAGRIRLEAFYRPIVPNATPVPSATAPTETDALTVNRRLWISDVAGEPVGPTPTGSLITPDVVFSQAGQIVITVSSENIPSGTPVELRISTSEGVINLPGQGDPAVTLNGAGTATFGATVPAGLGTIQATAEFVIGNGE